MVLLSFFKTFKVLSKFSCLIKLICVSPSVTSINSISLSNLSIAFSFNPKHLSLYQLTIEKGTAFHREYLNKNLKFKDVTDDYACFGLFGPKSRKLLTDIVGDEFENEKFPFGKGKLLNIENINIWFQRLSYVGELGWELYIPINKAEIVYKIIEEAGKKHNLIHAGRLAMDIMRMEKGYLHWSHDITPAENPFEAGLNFAVKLNKECDFLGKESLIASNSKL